MERYTVKEINTTDGKRYFLLDKGRVSLSHRTYFKTKKNAQKKANSLNN